MQTNTDENGQILTIPIDTHLYLLQLNNNNFKQSIMNQTKTAVILSIVAIVGIGVIIYALRDNFKSQKSVKTSSEIVAE